MGVYIKGVSKEALLQVLGANGIIHNSKDFVEVKEPHGRLIDADAVVYGDGRGCYWETEIDLRNAPTVIEAEDEWMIVHKYRYALNGCIYYIVLTDYEKQRFEQKYGVHLERVE